MGLQINGTNDTISAADGSLSISGTTNASALQVNSQNLPSAGPLSNRNIIINGAMQVDQRGTATGITGDNFGGPDRYKCFISGAGTWTLSQQADAPSGTGLYYSYKFQCTSTGTLSAGSYIGHRMILEGYDSARLNGQQFTISFWVKCNKTGTMTCEPFDASSGATQSVSKQFTINAADTWEYKTITFPANPHNYPANNAGALVLHWWLSAGSTWNSTASTGEWTNFANGFRAYGCNIDLLDSTSNYFQITGIQLEVGTVATPFEHRSFSDQLQKCKRYFQAVGSVCSGFVEGTDRFAINVPFNPEMRASPDISVFSGRTARFRYAASDIAITNPTLNNTTVQKQGVWTRISTSGKTNNLPITGRMNGSDADFIAANAEL